MRWAGCWISALRVRRTCTWWARGRGTICWGIRTIYRRRYRERLREWADRAAAVVRGNVGYVAGTVLHHWHGKTSERGYDKRWRIMVRASV